MQDVNSTVVDREAIVMNQLQSVGYERKHWWLNSRMLTEVEYMIETLKILVEPEFVPFSTSMDVELEDGNAEQYIPSEVKIAVWRRDGGKCVQCGSTDRLQYDQLIPISKGGSNTDRNIQLLCDQCARRKSVPFK